ncbi:hypothetical protein ACSBL2_14615 [Pedobacter sp. AW31-3R]|uniref:hypothetical protein n=1 Tax=Pedobacter sp. AW31-3R TaxID=3445781 RepID=UPI003F9FC2CC
MAFSFNDFFGYEKVINAHPDLVLIYGFTGIIFGLLALTFIAFILRKIHFHAIVEHLIAPLMWVLMLSFGIAVIPTLVLYFLANNVSGVKLIYCWMTILSGMTFFCFMNDAMIKKWMSTSKR